MLPPLPALPPLGESFERVPDDEPRGDDPRVCVGGRREAKEGRDFASTKEIGGGGVLMLLLLLRRGVAEASRRGGGELLLQAPPATTTCGTFTIFVFVGVVVVEKQSLSLSLVISVKFVINLATANYPFYSGR